VSGNLLSNSNTKLSGTIGNLELSIRVLLKVITSVFRLQMRLDEFCVVSLCKVNLQEFQGIWVINEGIEQLIKSASSDLPSIRFRQMLSCNPVEFFDHLRPRPKTHRNFHRCSSHICWHLFPFLFYWTHSHRIGLRS